MSLRYWAPGYGQEHRSPAMLLFAYTECPSWPGFLWKRPKHIVDPFLKLHYAGGAAYLRGGINSHIFTLFLEAYYCYKGKFQFGIFAPKPMQCIGMRFHLSVIKIWWGSIIGHSALHWIPGDCFLTLQWSFVNKKRDFSFKESSINCVGLFILYIILYKFTGGVQGPVPTW